MDQALLLLAIHGIVSAIEVAYQHAVEACQDVIQYGCFARGRIYVRCGVQVSEYPYVMATTVNDALSLVGMHQGATRDLFKNKPIRWFVFLSHHGFHVIRHGVGNRKIENGGDMVTNLLV